MSVSRDEVTRIAALAALDVEEGAIDGLAAQMSRILDYVSQLGNMEAQPLPPFRPASNAEPMALRDDVATPHDPPLDPRTFAPDVRDGLVVVPSIGSRDDGENA